MRISIFCVFVMQFFMYYYYYYFFFFIDDLFFFIPFFFSFFTTIRFFSENHDGGGIALMIYLEILHSIVVVVSTCVAFSRNRDQDRILENCKHKIM